MCRFEIVGFEIYQSRLQPFGDRAKAACKHLGLPAAKPLSAKGRLKVGHRPGAAKAASQMRYIFCGNPARWKARPRRASLGRIPKDAGEIHPVPAVEDWNAFKAARGRTEIHRRDRMPNAVMAGFDAAGSARRSAMPIETSNGRPFPHKALAHHLTAIQSINVDREADGHHAFAFMSSTDFIDFSGIKRKERTSRSENALRSSRRRKARSSMYSNHSLTCPADSSR